MPGLGCDRFGEDGLADASLAGEDDERPRVQAGGRKHGGHGVFEG